MARLKLEAGGGIKETEEKTANRLTGGAWHADIRAKRDAAEWALLTETNPEKQRRLRALRDRYKAMLIKGPEGTSGVTPKRNETFSAVRRGTVHRSRDCDPPVPLDSLRLPTCVCQCPVAFGKCGQIHSANFHVPSGNWQLVRI